MGKRNREQSWGKGPSGLLSLPSTPGSLQRPHNRGGDRPRSTAEAGRPPLNRIKRPPGATALFFLQKRLHYPGPPIGGVRSTDLPGAVEAGDGASQSQAREPPTKRPRNETEDMRQKRKEIPEKRS